MRRQETNYVIEVLNCKPSKVGFALSEKDGRVVGKHRFSSCRRAREFPSEETARQYIDSRYDGDKYDFQILGLTRWVD